MKNTSNNAGASLLKEVLCYTLGRLKLPGALKFDVGLINPRKPSKAELTLLEGVLDCELRDCEAWTALVSRFNVFGTSHKRDVVLIREGAGFTAAQIVLHADLAGEPISIVNVWTLRKIARESGYSEWSISHNPELIPTDHVLDTVISTRLAGDRAGVLLPCEFR